MLNLAKLLPYLIILDLAVEAARDKHSSLLRKFENYEQKKFYNIGPCTCPRALVTPQELGLYNLVVTFLH